MFLKLLNFGFSVVFIAGFTLPYFAPVESCNLVGSDTKICENYQAFIDRAVDKAPQLYNRLEAVASYHWRQVSCKVKSIGSDEAEAGCSALALAISKELAYGKGF